MTRFRRLIPSKGYMFSQGKRRASANFRKEHEAEVVRPPKFPISYMVVPQSARYPRRPQSRRFAQRESLKRNWSDVSFSREKQTDTLATAPFLASASRAS